MAGHDMKRAAFSRHPASMSSTYTVPMESPQSPFRLPITYVDGGRLHTLSDAIVADLELHPAKFGTATSDTDTNTDTDTEDPPLQGMYMHLFAPSTEFGRERLPDWTRYYTSDTTYLEDTQTILQTVESETCQDTVGKATRVAPLTRVLDIWDHVTQHDEEDFMDKYNFIGWGPLRGLNGSSWFLQLFSMINLSSPIFSLLMPLVLLVVPFVLLRVRGVPLTMEQYVTVLADIARHHFIGKAIATLRQGSFDKWMYGGIMLGFYLLQIYQNVTACLRFYQNLSTIQRELLVLKTYVTESADAMEGFVQRYRARLRSSAYAGYCRDVAQYAGRLRGLQSQLAGVHDRGAWTASTGGWSNVGYMLTCYYRLHSDTEVQTCVNYSMGFHGWMEHLRGLGRRWRAGDLGLASFSACPKDSEVSHVSEDSTEPAAEPATELVATTKFVQQYYLPLGPGSVRNDGCLDRHWLITGPNAAGKTTYLKTTLLNVLLTQQVGAGCYTEAWMPQPYTHLHSYLNIPDTSERDSLFQAEARRCKEILDLVQSPKSSPSPSPSSRHFCIFDELYSGTNPHEATKAAYAFLQYLSTHDHVDFLLTTHYTEVCERLAEAPRIRVAQMAVEVDPDTDRIQAYTYRVVPGISRVEGATQVLTDMGYPDAILKTIRAFDPLPTPPEKPVAVAVAKGTEAPRKRASKNTTK